MICSARLKVEVTLEGQMIKWSSVKLVRAITLHLCIDFKMIWHRCSFETFVQVL